MHMFWDAVCFAVIHIWRNLSTPVRDTSLAKKAMSRLLRYCLVSGNVDFVPYNPTTNNYANAANT